jgi:hypothetical protein
MPPSPLEVLIVADDETPKKLVREHLALTGSNFTYGVDKLVLWTAQPGLMDDQGALRAYLKTAPAKAVIQSYSYGN